MGSGPRGTVATPQSPTRIADYRIERQVGEGGMGVVYLATEERLGRRVALKVLPPRLAGDESFRERFMRESRLAASIDHPNVIPIFRAGEEGDVLFLVMPYVDGPDLGALLREQGALPPARALEILKQVAAGLDAAHRAGLVHRDVKPANVLLQPGPGEREHCYLTDFGLTKSAAGGVSMTEPGQVLGTANYMSPEQIRGEPVGPMTDTYSLACLLFETLTGRVPYPRPTQTATLAAHLTESPPSARALRPELPPAIDQVIARALAKDPGIRHRGCGSFAAAAASALTGTADSEDRAGVPPAAAASALTGTADSEDRAGVPPPVFSSANRTRPEPAGARVLPPRPRPPTRAPSTASAPPRYSPPPPRSPVPPPSSGQAPKPRRGPLVPAAIVAVAILLCAGAVAAALILTGGGPSDTELSDARNLLDRTTRINDRLSKLAVGLRRDRAGSEADRIRLEADRKRAEALQRDIRAQIETQRAIRESLISANKRLAEATEPLKKATTGDTSGLEEAIGNLTAAAKDTDKAKKKIEEEMNRPGKSGGGGGLPKGVDDTVVQLPGDAAFTIEPPYGATTSSLAGAADVNGDGTPDLLVGSTSEGVPLTHVLFGGSGLRRADLDDLGDRGFVVESGDGARPAGDLDGDGNEDILVPEASPGEGPADVYALSGTGSAERLNPLVDGGELATITPPPHGTERCSGIKPVSATGAGDVNGDGRRDVVVTAPCYGSGGEVWVVFGPWQTGDQVNLDDLGERGFQINGAPADGEAGLGAAVDAGGDLNDDGKDDLVLGAPDRAGGPAAHVVFGTDATDSIDVEALGSSGYTLTHSGSDGALGTSVALPGDMNGDDTDDLVVGDPGATAMGRDGSGAAYVVFGGDAGDDLDLASLGSGGFEIAGPARSTGSSDPLGLGTSVAAAGDVNGDENLDVILGSPGLRGSAGVAYVVYGTDSTEPIDLKHPGAGGFVIDIGGESPVVHVGGGADLDGSGEDDVVIAPIGGDGGGAAYVVSGGQ